MKNGLKKLVAIIACGLFSVLTIQSALAVEFAADDELIISQPLLDDSYVAGGVITVDEDITGDLYIAGGSITINGDIEGDLVVGGGQITINGDVSDDLRAAGGSISVNGNVGDDLVATGGQLNVSSSTLIGGSLIIGNGYANILGTVNEDLIGGGGRILLGGTVYQDVELEVQDRFLMTEDARINGNLIYTSLQEAEFDETQISGFIEFNKQKVEDISVGAQLENFFTRWHLVMLVLQYFSLLVLAAAMVLLVPTGLLAVSKVSKEHPWRSLGLGFLIGIASIAAAIILAITFIGFPLAGIIMLVLAISFWLSSVYAAAFIGSLLLKPKKMTKGKLFGIVALGGFILTVVQLVPILGGLVNFLVILLAFGALWTYKKELYDKLKLGKV